MKVNARKVVLEILDDCDRDKYANKLVQETYERKDLDERDKHFISRIVYGVMEHRMYLDFMIRKCSSVRLKKIDGSILNILRMSAYQMLFMDKTPDSAVVNEAVKLAKKASYRHAGFVNGLLRSLIRDGHKFQIPKTDKIQYLSVKYSHPEWMVKRWIALFGEDFTEDLLKANNEQPALSLRVNTLKDNREDLMTKLQSDGVICLPSDIVEEGIIVKEGKHLNLHENPLFMAGNFTVQDESSMMVSKILAPSKDERVLDLCAAPGGKTTHMAQMMANTGEIIACDISARKLALVQSNLERLGVENVKLMENDATVYNPSFEVGFDKVLVDAPCSGLGIIRRKPDIKYHKEMSDIQALSEIQTLILEHASHYVKPGGELVYSTCTIDPIENRQLITKFLEKHDGFEVITINGEQDLQLYPNVHETDGFYCCRLKKK